MKKLLITILISLTMMSANASKFDNCMKTADITKITMNLKNAGVPVEVAVNQIGTMLHRGWLMPNDVVYQVLPVVVFIYKNEVGDPEDVATKYFKLCMK